MIPGRKRPNVAALTRAVQASADWRGSVTGDDEMTDEFDREIARQRKALRDLRRHLAYHNALRSFVGGLALLNSEEQRDEKRTAALLQSAIRRAQILYP